MTTYVTRYFLNCLGLNADTLEEIGDIDVCCPGFHQCVDRSFEGDKEDCQECREDSLNAMEAIDREGYKFDAMEAVKKGG